MIEHVSTNFEVEKEGDDADILESPLTKPQVDAPPLANREWSSIRGAWVIRGSLACAT